MKGKQNERDNRAVALRYEAQKEDAPRVIAKGRGEIARKIIEIAEQHGISTYEDRDLVEILSRLDINQIIPAELYQVIAEVLAFVYRVNGRASSMLKD